MCTGRENRRAVEFKIWTVQDFVFECELQIQNYWTTVLNLNAIVIKVVCNNQPCGDGDENE